MNYSKSTHSHVSSGHFLKNNIISWWILIIYFQEDFQYFNAASTILKSENIVLTAKTDKVKLVFSLQKHLSEIHDVVCNVFLLLEFSEFC